jgi:predicted Zn-dependent peptidase
MFYRRISFVFVFLFPLLLCVPASSSEKGAQETLPNGMTIFTLENPGTTSVAVDLWVKAGSRNESAKENGISHIVEHLLFKGTPRRTAKDISREIAAVGGYFNAFTQWEYTRFHISLLPKNLDLALDILSDVAQNSSLSEESIARERKVVLEEISLGNIFPPMYVLNLISKTLFPKDSAGLPIVGTKESVTGITRDDILKYYRRFYMPNNAFLTIVGNVNPANSNSLARDRFGTWRRRELTAPALFPPARQNRLREVEKSRFLDQAIVVIALQAMGVQDQDRPAFEIINAILGSGGNSRLYQEIREKRGLSYLVGSLYHPLTDTGFWGTYAGTDPQNVGEVRSIMFKQLRQIQEEPVPARELAEIKNYIRGRTLIRNESNSELGEFIGQRLLGGNWEVPDEFIRKIDAVTAQDVQRVARLYLREDQCNFIVLKPYPGLMLLRGLF